MIKNTLFAIGQFRRPQQRTGYNCNRGRNAAAG